MYVGNSPRSRSIAGTCLMIVTGVEVLCRDIVMFMYQLHHSEPCLSSIFLRQNYTARVHYDWWVQRKCNAMQSECVWL